MIKNEAEFKWIRRHAVLHASAKSTRKSPSFTLPDQHVIRLWREGSCRRPCVFRDQMAKHWIKAAGYSVSSGKFVAARTFESQVQGASSSGITHTLHLYTAGYLFPQMITHLCVFAYAICSPPFCISYYLFPNHFCNICAFSINLLKIILLRWCVKKKPGELPNSLYGSGTTGLSVVAMTFTPASELEVPSTSGRRSEKSISIRTGFMWTNKVNSQLKAKHCSDPEAAAVSSYSSRWMKQTEQISWGEQSVFSVCSEFKAAWSENKWAALLIQGSGGSKRIKNCLLSLDVDVHSCGMLFPQMSEEITCYSPKLQRQNKTVWFFKEINHWRNITQPLLFLTTYNKAASCSFKICRIQRWSLEMSSKSNFS